MTRLRVWCENPIPARGHVGVEHLTLALVAMNQAVAPPILSALGASQATLRAAILDRYRQAS